MQILKPVLLRVMGAVMLAVIASGCSAKARQSRLLARAESYFNSGDYDKAKIEYLNLLRADPRNATAIQRVGMIWFVEGAPLQALPYLQTARELAPGNLALRAKLASAFRALGHNAEARSEAISILQQSPGNDEALLLLADTSLSPEDIAYTEQQLRESDQPDKATVHLALAALFVRKGQPEDAVKEVERALVLDPKSVLAHMAMGNIWWSKNDLARAGGEFKTAAELDPVRSPARIKYAEFKVSTRAVEEAKTLLKEVTTQTPDYLPAWSVLAQIAAAEKKYDEALAFLTNVLVRDGENYEARMLQATIWLARGEGEKAERSLEEIDKRQPNLPPLKYQLARAYLHNNKTNQAALVLNEALTINPDYLEANLLLASINLRRGNAESVIGAMEALLKKRPTLVQSQLLLVEAYRSLARLDDAETILRQELDAAPQSSGTHFMLGIVLRQKKRDADARAAFEKALELAPENVLFLAQIVDLDIEQKNFPAALQRVEAEMQKTPGSASLQFLVGKIHAAQGDWVRAEAALLETLKRDPDFSNAAELLVTAYMATKRLPQAISELESILAKNPNNISALRTSALLYEKMGELDKARRNYESILSINPDDAAIMNNLAYLYSGKLNQIDRAYELARKVTAMYPRDAGAADTLGWILYKRGEYAQALALLQDCVGKLPGNPEVQFHLGMASYMMGKMDAARTALQQAAGASEDFPGKEEIQPRLAMLDSAGGKSTALSVGALETLVKQHPEDPLARTQLGEAYERQGEAAKAADAYEQALKLNPRLVADVLKLAQLNAGPLHNKDKAMEFAKRAKELAPTDPAVAGTLGALAFQAGNFTWAYSLLQESARQLPDNIVILHDAAWAAYSMGKVDEARQAMQRILNAAADSREATDAKSFLAMTALDQHAGDLAAAEPEVEKLLKANPNDVPALMARAAAQIGRGEAKAAMGTYLEVLRHYPDFAPAQKCLASLYFVDPENRSKAHDLAVKARKTLPDDPDLAQLLAEISYERKEFSYALQLLQESARKRPLDATGLYYLGMAHFQAKEKPQSRDALNQALAAGLKDPLAAEARRAIKELQAE